MILRIVGGTDVAAPKARPPASVRPADEDLDPVLELFELYRQARLDYQRAVAELAQRTGRSVRTIGHVVSARSQKRAKFNLI